MSWNPLTGHPLIRRTWVVWPEKSRGRDIALFVDELQFDPADGVAVP